MFRKPRKVASVKWLLLITLFISAPAHGWTQNLNDYPSNTSCGYDVNHPCQFWPEPHYTVGTITTYEDSSLNLGYYDFHSAVNRAISDFNSAPAYNPNFVTCTGGACNYEIYTGSIPCQQAMIYYGDTPDDYYSSTGFISGIGYYAVFNRVHTVFNTYNAHWNNSLTWSTNFTTCAFDADGRTIATHEMGHASSLGHTGYSAIMKQGPLNFYSLQPNDIAGLQAIYNGTSPN